MIVLLFFILGLFFGSFFGVLVDRTSRGEGIIKGRSYCEKCKKELAWYDLIPVISYIFLKGKCRYCKTKLSVYYPLMEVLTGIIFVLAFWSSLPYGVSIVNILYYLFIFSVFLIIFFTDIKYGIIPDRFIFAGVLINVLYLLMFERAIFVNHLASGIFAFIFFLVVSYGFYALTKKEGMGGGDIKLALFLGLFLGYPGILVCLYMAFLTGALGSIILILWKKKSFLKGAIPFGPYLILCALITFFFGNQIYAAALKLLFG